MDFGALAAGFGASALQQGPAMLFNARQAAMQRDWQQEMSDHAVQRRVADLSASGINPVLAGFGSGGGAGMGGGAQASVGGGPDPVASARDVETYADVTRRVKSEADTAWYNKQAAESRAGQEKTLDVRMGQELSADERAGVFSARSAAARAAADADEVGSRIERRIDEESGSGLRYAARLAGPVSSAASLIRSAPFERGRGLRPYSREAPGPGYLR